MESHGTSREAECVVTWSEFDPNSLFGVSPDLATEPSSDVLAVTALGGYQTFPRRTQIMMGRGVWLSELDNWITALADGSMMPGDEQWMEFPVPWQQDDTAPLLFARMLIQMAAHLRTEAAAHPDPVWHQLVDGALTAITNDPVSSPEVKEHAAAIVNWVASEDVTSFDVERIETLIDVGIPDGDVTSQVYAQVVSPAFAVAAWAFATAGRASTGTQVTPPGQLMKEFVWAPDTVMRLAPSLGYLVDDAGALALSLGRDWGVESLFVDLDELVEESGGAFSEPDCFSTGIAALCWLSVTARNKPVRLARSQSSQTYATVIMPGGVQVSVLLPSDFTGEALTTMSSLARAMAGQAREFDPGHRLTGRAMFESEFLCPFEERAVEVAAIAAVSPQGQSAIDEQRMEAYRVEAQLLREFPVTPGEDASSMFGACSPLALLAPELLAPPVAASRIEEKFPLGYVDNQGQPRERQVPQALVAAVSWLGVVGHPDLMEAVYLVRNGGTVRLSGNKFDARWNPQVVTRMRALAHSA
jgi:hypothetical protein